MFVASASTHTGEQENVRMFNRQDKLVGKSGWLCSTRYSMG